MLKGSGEVFAAARVVAYWSPVRGIRKICAEQCVGAKNFKDLNEMLAAYGLRRGAVTMRRPKRGTAFSATAWLLVFLWFALSDMQAGYRYMTHQQWGWALFEFVFVPFMMYFAWTHYRRLRARIG